MSRQRSLTNWISSSLVTLPTVVYVVLTLWMIISDTGKETTKITGSSSCIVRSGGGGGGFVTAFISPMQLLSPSRNRMAIASSDSSNTIEVEYHDVVLFGIGDLRVDDHGGLLGAIELQQEMQSRGVCNNSNSNIHCCLLCTDDVLLNICGIVSHTVDTVNCITSAIQELDGALRQNNQFGPLHCITSSSSSSDPEDKTNKEIDIFKYIQNNIIAPISSTTTTTTTTKIRVHVCDLGPIDNEMMYGAYGQLLGLQQRQQHSFDDSIWEVVPWRNSLRTEPWKEIKKDNCNTFPISYPEYQAQYTTSEKVVQRPQTVSGSKNTLYDGPTMSTTNQLLTTSDQMLRRLQRLLPEDHAMNDTINTGLYGTHYGGLPCTAGCTSILQYLHTYCTTCNEDDTIFCEYIKNIHHPLSSSALIPQRNVRSLEHAAMIWQLESNNWLDGEIMTRLLLVPLYLGTISPRRIWHMAGRPRQSILQTTLWNPPPLRTLVEGREWHNLLAARYHYCAIAQNQMTTTTTTNVPTPQYKYWRYHGMLCRYAQSDFVQHSKDDTEEQQKEGILLVHGFGASGSQWNKVMHELSNMATTNLHQGLAPDLIGFGQSEKPAVSYTSYMWDSQIMDFVKDVATYRHQWKSFITGGNSIGGYTSMSFAACDTAITKEVTSSGSSGTGRCTGLVLMNSAGPLKTKYEIEQEMHAENGDAVKSTSIAITTAALKLPSCNPPPRPVARLFGNVLLSYLRPNIQSICQKLYPTNPAAVDDLLVQDIERDSLDPGAINVMMAGAKLPPPRTSNELLGALFGINASPNHHGILESYFDGPVLISQGVLDPLNNSTDRMNRFKSLRDGIDIAPIQAGHCPHDELPYEVAQSIASWKSTLKVRNVQPITDTISSLQKTLK